MAVARTTQILKKNGSPVEDETTEAQAVSRMSTEFYGGEGQDGDDVVMEKLADPDLARPEAWFNHSAMLSIFVREKEVAAARKKGRKKTSIVQMKLFDDAFRCALHTSVPTNDVLLSEVQLGFRGADSAQVATVLQYQDAVLQQI